MAILAMSHAPSYIQQARRHVQQTTATIPVPCASDALKLPIDTRVYGRHTDERKEKACYWRCKDSRSQQLLQAVVELLIFRGPS